MKRLQILFLWLALALSAYAQPTAGAPYQLTLAKINAAIGSGTLAVAKIGGGTPGAGKYVDGGTGNWTTLPSASSVDLGNITAGTLSTTLALGSQVITSTGNTTWYNAAAKYIKLGINSGDLLALGTAAGTQGDDRFALGRFGTAYNGALAGIASTANTTLDSNVATGGSITQRVNNVAKLTVNGTAATLGAINLVFNGAGVFDSSKTQIYADAAAGNLIEEVPTGKYLDFVAGTQAMLTVGFANNAQGDNRFSLGKYSTGTTDGTYAGIASTAATALDSNVATGGTITQRVNNVTVVNVTSTGAAVAGKFYVSTTQTPASASAAGTTGQICWDASYLYVCVNTNTWTRVAIATW